MYRLRVTRPSPSVLGESAQASDVLSAWCEIITNYSEAEAEAHSLMARAVQTGK